MKYSASQKYNRNLLIFCITAIIMIFFSSVELRLNLNNRGFLRIFTENTPVIIWWFFAFMFGVISIIRRKFPFSIRLNYVNLAKYSLIVLVFLIGKTLVIFLSPPEESGHLAFMPLISQWYEAPSIFIAVFSVFKIAIIEESGRMFLIERLGKYALPVTVVIFTMGHGLNYIDMPFSTMLIFVINLIISSTLYYLIAFRLGLVYAIVIHMLYDLININIFQGYKFDPTAGYLLGTLLVFGSIVAVSRLTINPRSYEMRSHG